MRRNKRLVQITVWVIVVSMLLATAITVASLN